MNSKTKALEKIALGTAVMFGLYWLYSMVIRPQLLLSDGIKGMMGLAVLYGAGLGLFALNTKKISTKPYAYQEKKRITFKTLVRSFLLQCTAFMILNVLAIVTSIFGGESSSTEMLPMTSSMLFMLLVFNPIVEEFVFRHLFAGKLLQYGQRFYILASAFCFALVHGVSVDFGHIIYTFILGMIWAYLTVQTGNIALAVLMHALSNFFNAIIIQMLFDISTEAVGIYSILLMALGVVGLVLFLKNRRKIILDGTPGLINRQTVKDLFSNKGIWFYTVLTLIVMLLKGK